MSEANPNNQNLIGPEQPSAHTTDVPAARHGSRSQRLPVLLAALCDRLPDDRIVLETVASPTDPLFSRFISTQSAAGLAQQLTEITRVWRVEAPGMSGQASRWDLSQLGRNRPEQW
ncbi:hypothetical protein [Streptomyces sp. NPDC057257]|uniref:hypothetical protein n=1 Tax=Streptomyces sp. NPDC057257 TaxID=3346071 RepID=UPI0036457616